MSGLLIGDGRRTGHVRWCVDSVARGIATGTFISPFSTPRITLPRSPSGADVTQAVRDVGGEVLFDPMTHARFLPSTDKVDFYDTWELWGSLGPNLASSVSQLDHIERVFGRQATLGVAFLAPTITLNSAVSGDVATAYDLARTARGLEPNCYQSLAGTRQFWADGSDLDAYVGRLAALRAPVWVLTLVNELVVDGSPDLSRTDAFEGLLRTVHSLSRRSRVILAHADYAGMPAVAAGADTLGSGWDRSQRTFDPRYFRVDSDPGIRIPASYVTQGGLSAVLRRDAANAIERLDSTLAMRLRGGPMPPSDQAEWFHHLSQVKQLGDRLTPHPAQRTRVDLLRHHYEVAALDFDALISTLPSIVKPKDKSAWNEGPYEALKAYASAEGIW